MVAVNAKWDWRLPATPAMRHFSGSRPSLRDFARQFIFPAGRNRNKSGSNAPSLGKNATIYEKMAD
jgi:hypothetical protein